MTEKLVRRVFGKMNIDAQVTNLHNITSRNTKHTHTYYIRVGESIYQPRK